MQLNTDKIQEQVPRDTVYRYTTSATFQLCMVQYNTWLMVSKLDFQSQDDQWQ